MVKAIHYQNGYDIPHLATLPAMTNSWHIQTQYPGSIYVDAHTHTHTCPACVANRTEREGRKRERERRGGRGGRDLHTTDR